MKIEFKEGWLDYTAGEMDAGRVASDFRLSDWDGGYLAWSNKEKPLAAVAGAGLAELLAARSEADGYLMEVALWRKRGETIFEEASVERDDGGFFVQRWSLDTKAETPNCFYRMVDSTTGAPNSALVSGKLLKTVEVVDPSRRLNFFITRG